MDVNGRSPEFLTIPDLVDDRAGKWRDEIAFTIDGRSLTYSALAVESLKIASGLAQQGIQKGDRVATLLYNSSEQVLLWLACCRLGAICAPMNVGLKRDDLNYTVNDIDPRILVTDNQLAEMLEDDRVNIPRRCAVYTQHESRVYPCVSELLSGEGFPQPRLEPSDTCSIIYTGGTTGMPKGVMLSQFYYIVSAYRWDAAFHLSRDDHHFSVLQGYHVALQTNSIIAPLLFGYRSTVDRWFSLSKYWERVREVGATLIDPMGSMFTLLVNQQESDEDKNHNVRAAWGATAMLPSHIEPAFSRRFGIDIVPTFGGTEIGGSAVINTPLGQEHKKGTNGRANGWCEIAVVDRDDVSLPANSVGEIVVRPTIPFSTMNGYHNNEKRTLECTRNLWIHTGDLGSIDDDGWLTFVGRQAHWLRRRSENISAYEIEAAISKISGIAEVVVVGVPSELGEDEVKAFIVPQHDHKLQPEEIVSELATQIAHYKVPRYIEFVDDLPRSTAKQEIERHKLKALNHSNAWDRLA